MKSIRFDPLLALMGLGLFLILSIEFLPPLSLKDVEQTVRPATLAEPKQDGTARATDAPRTTTASTVDNGVADQLRNLITGTALDRLVSRKADRAGIEAFYSAHNYVPLWVTNNVANQRAKSAMAYLARADTVGLEPSDYPVPDFKSASTADALAEAELKLTASALAFARHAQIGRIHFSRVGTDIQYELVAPEPADVLAKFDDGRDAPQHCRRQRQ